MQRQYRRNRCYNHSTLARLAYSSKSSDHRLTISTNLRATHQLEPSTATHLVSNIPPHINPPRVKPSTPSTRLTKTAKDQTRPTLAVELRERASVWSFPVSPASSFPSPGVLSWRHFAPSPKCNGEEGEKKACQYADCWSCSLGFD